MMKISFGLLMWLCGVSGFAQMDEYTYKREVKDIKDNWHSISLPEACYEKFKSPYDDIRIYGITDGNDTIEAPYLMQVKKRIETVEEVRYELINQSHDAQGYYYTFKLQNDVIVNEILLRFGRNNFDWKVKLEGSFDQRNWKTLLEQYRILSIHDGNMDYAYTDLRFPNTNYIYYRLFIPSSQDPGIVSPILKHTVVEGGEEVIYAAKQIRAVEEDKTSVYEFQLTHAVPVSMVKIRAKDPFDYYRIMDVYVSTDSLITPQGKKPHFRRITQEVLNSIRENDFEFSEVTASHFKIVIQNADNQPLHIDQVIFGGYVHELIVRFNEKARYYMVYGNANARVPEYDITHFQDKIPVAPASLSLGDEVAINGGTNESEEKSDPLFTNKAWLWFILLVIIAVLAIFTYRMMRAEGKE